MICEACGRPYPDTESDASLTPTGVLTTGALAVVALWWLYKPVLVALALAASTPILLAFQATGIPMQGVSRKLSIIGDVFFGDIPMIEVPFLFVSDVLTVHVFAFWALVAVAAYKSLEVVRRRKA